MSKDGDGEEATEEARKGQNGEKAQNGAREQEGGGEEQQGLRCGRPTLTRDWVGTRVKDPIPIVSLDPTEDQPRPEGAEGKKK